MTQASPLLGRRIHIAGSVNKDPEIATPEEVELARGFVSELVIQLIKEGCTFVVPVDAENLREDSIPICFDWLIWETLHNNLISRPFGSPQPLAVAVQHHKSEDQIPENYIDLWDQFKGSDLVSIDNASHWNMASKRMEIQASRGDILITLGGCEGVLFLANLYNQAGKPVVPLDLKLCRENQGSRRLFRQAMGKQSTHMFFQVTDQSPHDWINRLNFGKRHGPEAMAQVVVGTLRHLRRPTVFAVRLLNKAHEDFNAVEEFFSNVVSHVVEVFGYELVTIDESHANAFARIDEEIFRSLHHSSVVVADITASRPNCFIELGYALGRSLPTIMTGKEGTENPFDTKSVSGYFWNPGLSTKEKRREFLEHWKNNIRRPPLVNQTLLVP